MNLVFDPLLLYPHASNRGQFLVSTELEDKGKILNSVQNKFIDQLPVLKIRIVYPYSFMGIPLAFSGPCRSIPSLFSTYEIPNTVPASGLQRRKNTPLPSKLPSVKWRRRGHGGSTWGGGVEGQAGGKSKVVPRKVPSTLLQGSKVRVRRRHLNWVMKNR